MVHIEESVGIAATKIAQDISANCIISIDQELKIKEDYYTDDYTHLDVIVAIFRRDKDNDSNVFVKSAYSTKLRKIAHGSIIPIKELLMEAISKEYIKKNDRVVCIVDESVGMGYKGLIFIFDVDKIFFNISAHNLTENVNSDVLESVIEIAMEIAREGREGRKIGTSFIIGDKEEVLRYTKQMIINPFTGYDENLRKITDPIIRETVKEFSQLDGVFIIDKNGVIISSGSYLNVDTADIALPGLGSRHRSCCAITKMTKAIAVVVSSSGKISVFKDGRIVMKI